MHLRLIINQTNCGSRVPNPPFLEYVTVIRGTAAPIRSELKASEQDSEPHDLIYSGEAASSLLEKNQMKCKDFCCNSKKLIQL
jgi:hypothetical protein